MKTALRNLVLAAIILLPVVAMTADQPVRAARNVVFEVTSDGPEKWLGALRNVENAQKSLGAAAGKLVVVTHGKGLGLLLAKNVAENSELKTKIEKLHADGIVFAACENTMRRDKVEKKDLVEQATTVDSGVGETVRKQAEGFAYIKIGG